MKHKILLGFFLLILFPINSSAQLIIQSQSTKARASVIRKNGDIKIGDIYGFIDRISISFASAPFSASRNLKLIDNLLFSKTQLKLI